MQGFNKSTGIAQREPAACITNFLEPWEAASTILPVPSRSLSGSMEAPAAAPSSVHSPKMDPFASCKTKQSYSIILGTSSGTLCTSINLSMSDFLTLEIVPVTSKYPQLTRVRLICSISCTISIGNGPNWLLALFISLVNPMRDIMCQLLPGLWSWMTLFWQQQRWHLRVWHWVMDGLILSINSIFMIHFFTL